MPSLTSPKRLGVDLMSSFFDAFWRSSYGLHAVFLWFLTNETGSFEMFRMVQLERVFNGSMSIVFFNQSLLGSLTGLLFGQGMPVCTRLSAWGF